MRGDGILGKRSPQLALRSSERETHTRFGLGPLPNKSQETTLQHPFSGTIGKPWVKTALTFVAHQFIGTWGVAIAAPPLAYFSFGILHPLNPHLFTSHDVSVLLTKLPYFPIQIVLGLWLGWSIGRRFQHRSMLWVWVLPLAFLCYALLAIPTLTPSQVPPMFQAGLGESRLSHYFGRGCSAVRRCGDQLLVTMPFCASVAYSVGALLARKVRRKTPLA